jgi:hypothetical protein
MHEGQPPGGAADLPGGPGLVGRALAIVVELAGAPPNERLSRLVRTARELTGADAVAVSVVGADGRLQPGTASSDAGLRMLHVELSMRTGPSIACRDQGRPLPPTRLATWPRLAAEAIAYGLSTVDALPLRTADRSIGALTSYWSVPYTPPTAVHDLTQALADVTALGLVTDHTVAQLETGLRSRTVIEQARGYLAAYHAISIDEALSVLRTHAHNTNRDIHEVAAEIVSRRPRS